MEVILGIEVGRRKLKVCLHHCSCMLWMVQVVCTIIPMCGEGYVFVRLMPRERERAKSNVLINRIFEFGTFHNVTVQFLRVNVACKHDEDFF